MGHASNTETIWPQGSSIPGSCSSSARQRGGSAVGTGGSAGAGGTVVGTGGVASMGGTGGSTGTVGAGGSSNGTGGGTRPGGAGGTTVVIAIRTSKRMTSAPSPPRASWTSRPSTRSARARFCKVTTLYDQSGNGNDMWRGDGSRILVQGYRQRPVGYGGLGARRVRRQHRQVWLGRCHSSLGLGEGGDGRHRRHRRILRRCRHRGRDHRRRRQRDSGQHRGSELRAVRRAACRRARPWTGERLRARHERLDLSGRQRTVVDVEFIDGAIQVRVHRKL